MNTLFDFPIHRTAGSFTLTEKNRACKFHDYLLDIISQAEGFKLLPRDLVTKRRINSKKEVIAEIVDAELIKDMISNMFEYTNINIGKNEELFYKSYLFCAISLMSLEFDYFEIPEHDITELELISFSFPKSLSFIPRLDFEMLIQQSDIVKEDDKFLFQEDFFPYYMSYLYNLLSGKDVFYKTMSFICKNANDPSRVEIDSDYEPDIGLELSDIDYAYEVAGEEAFEEQKATLIDLANTPITRQEIIERHNLSIAKLKMSFPGYLEYIKNMEQFINLFDVVQKEEFNNIIRDLISGYLLCEGKSIYSDEDRYLDIMAYLYRAKKVTMKSF